MNSHSILSGPGFELGQTLSRRRRHGRGSRRRRTYCRGVALAAYATAPPQPWCTCARSGGARDSAFASRICLRGCSAQFQGNERLWVFLIDFCTYDASKPVSHFMAFSVMATVHNKDPLKSRGCKQCQVFA